MEGVSSVNKKALFTRSGRCLSAYLMVRRLRGKKPLGLPRVAALDECVGRFAELPGKEGS